MVDNNNYIKKDISSKNVNELNTLLEKKIEFFKDVIQKTIIHVHKNKRNGILGISDVISCVEKLGEVNKKISEITGLINTNSDTIINGLQLINNELSSLLKIYGTDSLEDLLVICFGNNSKITTNDKEKDKFDIIKKYFHPTSYKVSIKKEDNQNNCNVIYPDKIENLQCCEVASTYKQFHMKVYGMKLYINSSILKKTLIVVGVFDDIVSNFMNNKYINLKYKQIKDNIPNEDNFKSESFDKFLFSLSIKDYLIYDNHLEIYNKFAGDLCQYNLIKLKPVANVIKEFITDDIYNKRQTLIILLIKSSNYENQYLAYLLYDLLSNDVNGAIDTQEQTSIFDSFPWSIKEYFKQAMKKTIQYTNKLSNFDINKIPLEQQICLLKVSDTVKEKAMIKLKEIKSKSDDSCSKARQYLDGLLKIPFSIYKKEPILNIMELIRTQFRELYKKYNIDTTFPEIPNKQNYTSIEVLKYIQQIQSKNIFHNNNLFKLDKARNHLISGDKKKLFNNIIIINELLEKHNLIYNKIKYIKLNKEELKVEIDKYIELCKVSKNEILLQETISHFNKFIDTEAVLDNVDIKSSIDVINSNMLLVKDYMYDVKKTLDKSVHGHDKAKKQIERIIGQWINGEQTGYCFGFEGPPGVGKTSLAKIGLSECLKDDDGNSRPFAMIQMGGDCNGSTLHGHNYTYVGSTWGSIVQILIDKKCMNPIIFIDEVDKISRTEHGKEIVGILTHLLDPTQNDVFQDKYYTGIDLDLSKALFILSYNDVDAIDKILLDRVHRVKFTSLSLEDKIIISKSHILPELYKKLGLEGMIHFSEEVLKFIIDEYTFESGVRKLKEILFEILGEINLDILKMNNVVYDVPIEITIDNVKNKYFKDKREIFVRKVPNTSEIGYINGMYATANGNGGTLPIHAKFFPSNTFLDLKLTGLQQEVMRESMNVSLTVAWNLTNINIQNELRSKYDIENNKCGINIHTGDGSVQKDGPSGGCAITIVIYSLLNNILIKPEFGVTGEIQMSGDVTAIGGLSSKILGSIKSSVKSFIFPKENQKDFDEFYEKYKNDERLKGVNFYPVTHVNEALELILDK